MHVVIFEGIRWDTFAPLAFSKPTFMLPCGMGTLLDKQLELLAPSRLTLWVRPEMAEYCRKHVVPTLKIPTRINESIDDEPTLITTGRTLHFAKFELPEEPAVVLEEGKLVRFARVEKMGGLGIDDVLARNDRWLKLSDLPQTVPQGRYVEYVWDLIAWNEEALIADFVRWRGCMAPPADGPWHIVSPENVCVLQGAKLGPGCVIDGSRGPVVIDVGAGVGANSVIEGPCYIGKYARISPLSTIHAGTTIGQTCKIGGEISNSIISPFTNKAHDGYVGDSFIGSWVNLGAGTTTSNLKNTYGEVNMEIGSREYKTGRRMLGSIIGDHTKTAIGTRLNTGSYIGYNSLLAGPGLTPKFIPSFSFWTEKGIEKYELNKATDVARRMLDRRDQAFTATDEQIMRYVAEVAPTVEA